ncbi:MAG: copper resistance D family protein, partial [Tateyamaria sp.]
IGHVPAKDTPWLSALLLIHLIVAAFWIGILGPLQRLALQGTAEATADLGHRFGQIAALAVPLLILAGLVIAYVLVGSIGALIGTGYGQALILKVAIVGLLLGAAAVNKLRFVPKLAEGDRSAAGNLSRSITYEWIAFIAILFVTATLTSALTLPA